MQDFGHFLGRFYCRAGIEQMIERTKGTFDRHKEELWDVTEGSAMGDLLGVDSHLVYSMGMGIPAGFGQVFLRVQVQVRKSGPGENPDL